MRLLYIVIIAVVVIGTAGAWYWYSSQNSFCCGSGSPALSQLISSSELQVTNLSDQNISFKAGSSYDPEPLSDALGRTVVFSCGSSFSTVCATNSEGILSIKGDFEAKIGTCCNSVGCAVFILPVESDERDVPCLSERTTGQ
jgi:hypothetical protein